LGIPVIICVIAIVVPLQPLIQQGMLGIIFIWLEIELVFGNKLGQITSEENIDALFGIPQPSTNPSNWFFTPILAMGMTLALSLVMVIIGRSTLGEGTIALLYLIPIGFCTFRWGRLAGASASVTAAISFDTFLLPHSILSS